MSFKAHLPVFKINPCCSITFRTIKNINVSVLAEGFATHLSTPDDLVLHYNDGLQMILDVCAVLFANTAPWFIPELWQKKVKGFRLERLNVKTGLAMLSICKTIRLLFSQLKPITILV